MNSCPARPGSGQHCGSTLFICLLLSLLCLSCISEQQRHRIFEAEETVVASWYGDEFQGKPTASGEPFDKNALTAAHRDLPFGSKLKVTNPANGRSVVVTVNDRGPFVTGRELDLSYGAAREIDLLQTGRVMVQYVGLEPRYVHAVTFTAIRGPYAVQVGAFEDSENALRLKKVLELRYQGVYTEVVMKDNVPLYRVRIGIFEMRQEAQKLAESLAAEGYRTLITRYQEAP